MNTSVGRRRTKIIIQNTDIATEFTHDLNMYKTSPLNTITLNEFEELAMDRLQLLRSIEQATAKGHKQYSDEWKNCIKEELSKLGLKRYLRLLLGYDGQTEQDIQARRDDHHSHFILRLAYCRSEDLRRWFLSREMEWFKLRFMAQNQQGIMRFLEINHLTYLPIPQDVKERMKEELIMATVGYVESAAY